MGPGGRATKPHGSGPDLCPRPVLAGGAVHGDENDTTPEVWQSANTGGVVSGETTPRGRASTSRPWGSLMPLSRSRTSLVGAGWEVAARCRLRLSCRAALVVQMAAVCAGFISRSFLRRDAKERRPGSGIAPSAIGIGPQMSEGWKRSAAAGRDGWPSRSDAYGNGRADPSPTASVDSRRSLRARVLLFGEQYTQSVRFRSETETPHTGHRPCAHSNAGCGQRTFVEEVPGLPCRHGQLAGRAAVSSLRQGLRLGYSGAHRPP